MKRFRHPVIAVVTAFAITYGVLVFLLYRSMIAEQLHPTTGYPPKFYPETAWIFAAVDTLIIFAVITIIGFIVTVIASSWRSFRSRHRNHSV
jgi:hypothetical protein